MEIVSDYTGLLFSSEDAGRRWNFGEDEGTPAVVTYRFAETDTLPSGHEIAFDVSGVFSPSEVDRESFRNALDNFSEVSGVIFVETDNADANLRFTLVRGIGLCRVGLPAAIFPFL